MGKHAQDSFHYNASVENHRICYRKHEIEQAKVSSEDYQNNNVIKNIPIRCMLTSFVNEQLHVGSLFKMSST